MSFGRDRGGLCAPTQVRILLANRARSILLYCLDGDVLQPSCCPSKDGRGFGDSRFLVKGLLQRVERNF